MATVREGGYRNVIIRALENYRDNLEMAVDTCILVADQDGERETLKEWTRVDLTLKKLARENDGIT